MTATSRGGNGSALGDVVAALKSRERFVLASHARPDGDSIGSELALAFALRALGKEVRVINRDPAPPFLQSFPGVADIEGRELCQWQLRCRGRAGVWVTGAGQR